MTMSRPENHPALRLIGAIDTPEPTLSYDPAVEHDHFLADAADPPAKTRRKRKRAR